MDSDEYRKIILELTQGYEPGSSHWVRVTHVNDPHSFFVRSTKYNAFLLKMESNIPTEKVNKASLHQWIVYELSSSSSNTQYIRGQILNIDEKGNEITCDIFAFDYGNLHKSISLKNIWKCLESIVNIPPLALQCQLAHCSPIGNANWSDEAVEAVKYYFGDERAKMIVVDKLSNKLVVEMINTCPDDIATLMALTGYSTLGYTHNMVSRTPAIPTKKNYYNFKSISVNKTLQVRMLYGVSKEKFYVAEINDYSRYMTNREMVTNKSKKEKEILGEELVVGLPVCVLDEFRNSERGLVKSIIRSRPEAIVQLVDTGREVQAHIINMRHVPQDCLTDSPCAIYCSATPNELLITRLNEFIEPGYQFFIRIQALGHQFDSPNIVRCMLTTSN